MLPPPFATTRSPTSRAGGLGRRDPPGAVGSAPLRAVHLVALFALIAAAPAPPVETSMPETPQSRTLFDFEAGTEPWSSIDDVVMGGVSRSEMVVEGGRAVFRGEVSLESGGGFASVRSAPEPRDLSAFDGVEIRVRGDGRRYKLRLRNTAGFDGVNHQVTFEPPAGEWITLRFAFTELAPVFRGRPVADAPRLDPRRVHTFGFLISDRQAGPFRLEIDSIAAYREGSG